MTGAAGATRSFGQEAASSSSRGGPQAKTEGREMLKRITIGVLAIMMILAVGCGKTSDSLKEENRAVPDGVAVDFKVAVDDEGVPELLESVGNPILETAHSISRLYVSVPEGETAADMVETMNMSPLVEYAKPSCRPDEVVVGFNAWASDRERAVAFLESLGSCIIWDPEWGSSVVLSAPEGKQVADMVDILNSSPLVQFAEPCFSSADCDPAS